MSVGLVRYIETFDVQSGQAITAVLLRGVLAGYIIEEKPTMADQCDWTSSANDGQFRLGRALAGNVDLHPNERYETLAAAKKAVGEAAVVRFDEAQAQRKVIAERDAEREAERQAERERVEAINEAHRLAAERKREYEAAMAVITKESDAMGRELSAERIAYGRISDETRAKADERGADRQRRIDALNAEYADVVEAA